MARGTGSAWHGDELADRLVDAAMRVIAERGIGELTVRRIAEAADTSTMGVYSRFGGRTGVLEALYLRAYNLLGAALAAVPRTGDGRADLVALALAYRDFALAAPARYQFLFSPANADFAPSPELRSVGMQSTLRPLVEAVAAAAPDLDSPSRAGYSLWCVVHGLVGLEIAEVPETPMIALGLEPDAQLAERMFRDGVDAMLVGAGIAVRV